MKGVFYGRHSTDKQTMDTQRDMAKNFIKLYECEFAGEYLDAGVSARKIDIDKRKGISQLLADAFLRKYDFVVVSQHDRLARTPKEHALIRNNLRELKIPVIIASSESLYDSGDIIVDIIKDGNSKLEIDNTRIRTKDTLWNLLQKGKWRGGTPPFGYQYDKSTKEMVGIEIELEQVQKIFDLYLKFYGFDTIATKELAKGSYRGCDWTDNAVKAVVTNPFYAGYLTQGRKRKDSNNSFTDRSQWEMVKSELIKPTIISLAEWERCWDLYKQRSQKLMPPNRFKTSFLLQGLVYCCNQQLQCKDGTSKGKKGKVYGKKTYFCRKCDNKIELSTMHTIIDYLLSDIKKKHAATIVSNTLKSFKRDLGQLENDLSVFNTSLSSLINKTNVVNLELDEHFSKYQKVTDEAKIKDIESMIKILTMTKSSYQAQIESLQYRIKEKLQKIQFIDEIIMSKDDISKKINQITSPSVNPRLLRGLLMYLVKEISIDKSGLVDIHARYELLKTKLINTK
jgi:site-specific DNA recombinase